MAVLSNGTTLSFTRAGAGAPTAVGMIRQIGEIRMDSEMIDVTTLDAPGGFRAYAQGLRDAGEMTLEGYLADTEESQQTLRQMYLSGETAPFTVTFPDGETCAFSALVKGVTIGEIKSGGVVGFSVTLRLTGGVTLA